MESVFKECQHPDETERLRLNEELGLKPIQLKFWFQDRRTQRKRDREKNMLLHDENEKLKTEMRALHHPMNICAKCEGPNYMAKLAYNLELIRIENSQLRVELQKLRSIVSTCIARQTVGKPKPLQQFGFSVERGIGRLEMWSLGFSHIMAPPRVGGVNAKI